MHLAASQTLVIPDYSGNEKQMRYKVEETLREENKRVSGEITVMTIGWNTEHQMISAILVPFKD